MLHMPWAGALSKPLHIVVSSVDRDWPMPLLGTDPPL